MRKTSREASGPILEKMDMVEIPALIRIDISGAFKIGIIFGSSIDGPETPQDIIYSVYGMKDVPQNTKPPERNRTGGLPAGPGFPSTVFHRGHIESLPDHRIGSDPA